MNGRTALVDGDILVYLAGFASQKTIWTHMPSGEWFEGKEAANKWFKEENDAPKVGIMKWMKENWKDDEWDSEIVVEPWSNCQFIIDNKLRECMQVNDCHDIRVFLTPKTTFRHALAVTKEYKGNRKDTPKPVYKDEITKYLKESWGAETGDNIEADDLLGINQTTNTVICSNDKDLRMIPGEHYNFAPKKEDEQQFHLMDELGGDRWFFVQLIAGDSTDNIQGIPGYGVAKAEKIVDEFLDDGDWHGLAGEIEELYCQHYPANYREALEEHAALVWILHAGETPETAGWRDLLHEVSEA